MAAGTVQIHDVITGGKHADHTDGGTGFDNSGRQRGLVYQNDLAVSDPRDALFIGVSAVVDRYFSIGRKDVPVQVAGIDGKAVQNSDFHRVPP